MRNIFFLFICALTACSTPPGTTRQPVAGKANPAAVHCLQMGGQRVPVQSPQEVRTECKLPGGEVIDEWELWRRDHPQSRS